MKKTALIIGANGVTGRALASHLLLRPDWTVIGASRSAPRFNEFDETVCVDLQDAESATTAFAGLNAVTHVFYTAYVSRSEWNWVDHCAPNFAMLRNATDAIAAASPALQHICLMQGTKYYGQHLGPFKTPASEDDPRHMPPNFYYDQQDYLAEASAGRSWTWSAARPHVVCGLAVGNPLNLIAVLGVYAAISRELGLPLRFPGRPRAFETVYQATDSGLLAHALEWMATTPECANEAFNITNGDYFRYRHLWPAIARHFDMPMGEPQEIDLELFMSDKGPLWERMVEKHGLEPNAFAQVADWKFANYAFSNDWDVMSSTLKARQYGFHECVQSGEMFIRQLCQFQQAKIIP